MLDESAEDLYENAPCGLLITRADGTILRVNRTFERLTGFAREDLVGARRIQDLLAPGDRIYHETHYAPLLQMQRSVHEIAVELVRADGARLPAFLNSAMNEHRDGQVIRTAVFEASDRRQYERELLRARREEHDVAVRLQQGLLSKTLPTFAGLEVEVAYRPGRAGAEVGGDWYDAFHAGEDQEVMVVVGDVVGHGIESASQMGQLRSAVRAFAATGMGPAQLLEALDRYSTQYEVGRMATLTCALIDAESGRLRHASAGHLPPLIHDPEGEATFTWEGRSPPLAVPGEPIRPRREAECRLRPGNTLLLYTDGLVERRGFGLDPGMEQMGREVSRHGDKNVAVLAGELIRALHDPAHVDDVCLLVARLR